MRGVSSTRTCSALCAVALACSAAYAADYSIPISETPPLRGSVVPAETYPRWGGFYFGAQAGVSVENADFSNATGSLISFILQNTELQGPVSTWTTLGKGSTTTANFGAFMGYNFQWDQIIAGLEANYIRLRARQLGSAGSVGPIIIQGATLANGTAVSYSVTETSTASLTITDLLTMRGRVGWAIDRLLPYAFAGVALGRADFSRSASVSGTKTTTTNATPPVITTGPLLLPNSPQTESQNGVIAYGAAVGLGVEAAILPNLFLRAEWEFIQFAPIHDIRASVNSGRVGIGMKF